MGGGAGYQAGLIGCGGISRSHSAGLQAARRGELVALADVCAPILQEAAPSASSGPPPTSGS